MSHIPLRRGDTFSFAIAVTDEDALPADMSGWDVKASLLNTQTAAVVDVPASFTSAANGIGAAIMTPVETNAVPVGYYVLRVRLTAPGGEVSSTPPMFVEVSA